MSWGVAGRGRGRGAVWEAFRGEFRGEADLDGDGLELLIYFDVVVGVSDDGSRSSIGFGKTGIKLLLLLLLLLRYVG